MENTERIQKINWFYLFLNTLGPAVFMVGMIALGVALPQQFGLLCAFIGFGGAVLWWSFLGHRQYEKKPDQCADRAGLYLQSYFPLGGKLLDRGPCARAGSFDFSVESR